MLSDYREFSEAVKSLSDTFAKLQKPDFSYLDKLPKIVDLIELQKSAFPDFSELADNIRLTESSLTQMLSELQPFLKSMDDMNPVISNAILMLKNSTELSWPASLATPSLPDSLCDSIVESLRAGERYIEDKQKTVIDNIDPEILNPSSAPAPKPILSVSNLLAILGILMNIVFFIIQQLPNEQLEEITSQNETIIQQNDDLLYQHSEEIALLKQLTDTSQQITDLLEELDIDSLDTDDLDDAPDTFADPDQVPVDSPESECDSGTDQDAADAVKPADPLQ